MKTHTIRWNKDKTVRIITFTPEYMELLKQSYRETVSLIMGRLMATCSKLSSKPHAIDNVCMDELAKVFPSMNVPDCSYEMYCIKETFMLGYHLDDLEKDLKVLNTFFKMWYNENQNQRGEENGSSRQSTERV